MESKFNIPPLFEIPIEGLLVPKLVSIATMQELVLEYVMNKLMGFSCI